MYNDRMCSEPAYTVIASVPQRHRVSVIIPTYNRVRRLLGLIDLLLVQGCAEFDVIIVDDASTDGTLAAVEEKFAGRCTVLALKSNSGANVARHVGAVYARGDYYIFLDSDDRPRPGWMSHHVREMIGDPGVISVGGVRVVEGRGGEQPMPMKPGAIFDGNAYSCKPGFFSISSSLYHEVGGYALDQPASQHTELFYRLARRYEERPFGFRGSLGCCIEYVVHEASSIRKDHLRVARGAEMLVEKHRDFLARKDPQLIASHLRTSSFAYLAAGHYGEARRVARWAMRTNGQGLGALSKLVAIAIWPQLAVRFSGAADRGSPSAVMGRAPAK